MIIRKYGIELHRMKRDDIELIRVMRNRDDIRSRMFEQTVILPEQQEKWFMSVNNMHNYYFLIHYHEAKIGLIYGKNIDYKARENEGGIFIWDDSMIGSGIPTKASICLMELSFEFFLASKVHARVRKDNIGAYRHNLSLGYRPFPELGENQMILTREAYKNKIAYLRRLAAGGIVTPPLSVSDIEIPNANSQRNLYENLPGDILDRIKPLLKKPNGWL